MSIRYRVDRSDDPGRVPCGMNSILYAGASWPLAYRKFREASPYLTCWNQPSKHYGVLLSRWDDRVNDFIVVQHKGFNQ